MLDKYCFVGEIREHFFGEAGAAQDPQFHYVRDPFYFQNIQLQMQIQQMQAQAQAQQQAAATGQPVPDSGTPPGQSGNGGAESLPNTKDKNYENEQNANPNVDMSGQGKEEKPTELNRSLKQAISLFKKA
jgi:hypothetical protein